MRISVISFITLLFFCFAACKKKDSAIEQNLRLRYKGADMPLWVRGNASSKKILLFLHGGPGECAMCLRRYFTDAEKKIVMVYWDQRMAGSSGGSGNRDLLNYAQFADDLKQVVLLLRKEFPDKEVYLLGHSFGVEQAWQFLTTGENQNLVNGFIAMDGTYSTYEWLVTLRQWIMDKAKEKGATETYSYFSDLKLSQESISKTVNWGLWYKHMFSLDANPVWPSDDNAYNLQLWFFSPHSRFSQRINTSSYDGYYDDEIFTFNRKDMLKNVKIPVHIFWGKKDGIMPLSHAYQTSELLTGKPVPVLFEESWHSPFHTEQDKFTAELLKAIQ